VRRIFHVLCTLIATPREKSKDHDDNAEEGAGDRAFDEFHILVGFGRMQRRCQC